MGPLCWLVLRPGLVLTCNATRRMARVKICLPRTSPLLQAKLCLKKDYDKAVRRRQARAKLRAAVEAEKENIKPQN